MSLRHPVHIREVSLKRRRVRHATQVNKLCHTYECVKSYIWMHHVTQCCSVLQCVAVFCSVLQCVAVCCSVLQCVAVCCSVLQCVAMCHLDASRHTDERAMAHRRMSHVTRVNASSHTSKCVTSHIRMRYVISLNASCHTSECVMSQI